jgi:hypothetical protein
MPTENKLDLLPLTTAVKQVCGRCPHKSTLIRWATKGTRRGGRLQTWTLGGRRFTTLDAVRQFVEACSAEDEIPADRHEAAQRARAELKQAGW